MIDTNEGFIRIANELSCHHGLLSTMWQIGRPQIVENHSKIKTAAILWNKDGGYINFLFDKDFLSKLAIEDIAFVVAHECMHVLMNHGKRGKGKVPDIANIAMDITINDMLIELFGFRPTPFITEEMGICTRKTVFPATKLNKIEERREFEYYYDKLLENAKIIKIRVGDGEGVGTIDCHDFLPDELPDDIEDIIKELSKDEAEVLQGGLKPGDGAVYEWVKATLAPKPKEDWRKVIKNWTIKEFREKKKTQWKVLDRRFTTIQRSMPKVVIPSVGPIDQKFGHRIDMTFFMDASGSCASQSQAFFAAAKTIPKDKFIITPFAFNTELIPVSIEDDKLPVGGGTAFHQLEEYCLSLRSYPSTVFVLTDGEGTPVNPKYPDRWHIFLTYNYRACFPQGVNFYEFKDFHAN